MGSSEPWLSSLSGLISRILHGDQSNVGYMELMIVKELVSQGMRSLGTYSSILSFFP